MKCSVARDLLPLYFDGLCSEETKKQLEEHMEQCACCSQLKETLEPEQEWPDEKQEWDTSTTPLKKIKRKIHTKNILLGVCVTLLLLVVGLTALLTYGQICKKGLSFELLYDAVRFQHIGSQFASGNIEPLYETLSNGYLLQDEESSVLRLVYGDSETYDKDMKDAILQKYHQYFNGKTLTYKGIEEIGYCETAKMGWNKTLFITLKFEGDGNIEYYIALYKTLNSKYLVDDYFGNPYLSYTNDEENKETSASMEEPYHTDDTLFSCLPNKLRYVDLCLMRQSVLTSGQRALQGDTTLIENEQMRLGILSPQDLADGTQHFYEQTNDTLAELTKWGYYLTDITWNVIEYDKMQHQYKYEINMKLSDELNQDKIVVTLNCYRVADEFVYISGTDKIYENGATPEVIKILETLFD